LPSSTSSIRSVSPCRIVSAENNADFVCAKRNYSQQCWGYVFGHPDPLVRGIDPDLSHKGVERTEIMLEKYNFTQFFLFNTEDNMSAGKL
jgi:hypothetical protein